MRPWPFREDDPPTVEPFDFTEEQRRVIRQEIRDAKESGQELDWRKYCVSGGRVYVKIGSDYLGDVYSSETFDF